VAITPLTADPQANPGPQAVFKFRVTDKKTAQPVPALRDVEVSIMAAGNWSRREIARDEGNGIYSVEFAPPQAGIYQAHAQCRSQNVPFGDSPRAFLSVSAQPPAAQ
jgi:hypothetical protein